MFRQIKCIPLASIRNVGYIRNPKEKQKRLRDKVLSDSLKISPMTPMEKSRSDLKSKRNRFGLKVETQKVDHRQYGLDDKWKNLSKADRQSPYKVLRAADKEVIVSKNRDIKFGQIERISGDSFLELSSLQTKKFAKNSSASPRQMIDDAKIKEELLAVKPVLDKLFQRGKKKWGIKDDEARILGIEKIRRDVILCRLTSILSENQLRDKKRKQEVMKILNSNGRYFDRPISDVVTEMTKGRKHRCKVEFTWIAHDHSLVSDKSLLVEGFSKDDHDNAFETLSQLAAEERNLKEQKSIHFQLKRGLIENPEDHVFNMGETGPGAVLPKPEEKDPKEVKSDPSSNIIQLSRKKFYRS